MGILHRLKFRNVWELNNRSPVLTKDLNLSKPAVLHVQQDMNRSPVAVYSVRFCNDAAQWSGVDVGRDIEKDRGLTK